MAQVTVFLLELSFIFLIRIDFGSSFQTHRLSAINRLKATKINAGSSSNLIDYEVYNYTQTFDHFNFKPESYMTFQQRYVVIEKYWGRPTNNSPIFVYTGAESNIIGDVEFLGLLPILASQFNALLVYIEHRYYGTSMPFGSKTEAYKNTSTLGYFTSEQALADYAQIIVSFTKNMSAENCPVIVIGASYGGMLASWFRLKYPHIAYGAYASSAPILDFLGIIPENGYFKVVSKDFNSTSTSCYNTVKESWHEIDRFAAQSDGLSRLSQMFNTCMPLNTSAELKLNLEFRYAVWAQYDNPTDNSIQLFCNATDKAGQKTYILDKLIAGLAAVQGPTCFSIYGLGHSNQSGWSWQTCTELVTPFGRRENDTMFQANPFNLDKYTKVCQQVFGVTPRAYWIPIEFGGYGIKTVLEKFASNIIFSNGLRDPYSSGGVLQNISDTVVALYTEEGHHCLDLYTPLAADPDWLVAQRRSVVSTIQGWLSKYIAPDSLKS